MLEAEIGIKLLTSDNWLSKAKTNMTMFSWVPAKYDSSKEESSWMNGNETMRPKHNQKAK